ncbi:MAG: hypothetical protein H6817_07105 [Phycisphaerales bacterium]|nr:hypothetical protein [Phycisphaerales bacterium]
MQRNKQEAWQAPTVGGEINEKEVHNCSESRFAREVFDAINTLVDEPFRECCGFDEVRGGVVRIVVNRPEVLYNIRSLWQARLQRELPRLCRRGTIKRIVFKRVEGDDADRPERMGVRFPSPPRNRW